MARLITKNRIIIVLIVVLVCIIGVVTVMNNDYLRVRLYLGDRITGTIKITVDGKKYLPNVETLEYENSGTRRLSYDGVSQFTIKGGEYGNYKIGFKLDNEEMYRLTADSIFLSHKTDPMLIFSYMNTNWWNITKMDLSAEIVEQDDEWIVIAKVIYSESNEDGKDDTAYPQIENLIKYADIMMETDAIQFGV